MLERFGQVFHDRLPFSTAKTSHCSSTIFSRTVYDQVDKRRVIAEFEESDRDRSCPETCDLWNELVDDESHETVVIRLSLSESTRLITGKKDSSPPRVMVSVRDSLKQICDHCFSECKSLSCVSFGESRSLKQIGVKAIWPN